MSGAVSYRGTEEDHRARSGRQAPQSERRGAGLNRREVRTMSHPGDPIADTRGLAKERR